MIKPGGDPLTETTLNKVFDKNWADLEKELQNILAQTPIDAKSSRPKDEILGEILTTVRRLEQKRTTREPGLYERELGRQQEIDQITQGLLFSLASKSPEELKLFFERVREQRNHFYQSPSADAFRQHVERSSSSASSSIPSSSNSSSSSQADEES